MVGYMQLVIFRFGEMVRPVSLLIVTRCTNGFVSSWCYVFEDSPRSIANAFFLLNTWSLIASENQRDCRASDFVGGVPDTSVIFKQ